MVELVRAASVAARFAGELFAPRTRNSSNTVASTWAVRRWST
jgi:hypothetical protein